MEHAFEDRAKMKQDVELEKNELKIPMHYLGMQIYLGIWAILIYLEYILLHFAETDWE